MIVDVRPPKAFEQSHITSSVNVPMYKALNPLNSGVGGAFKFLAYSLNGVSPVETNEDFIAELKQVWPDCFVADISEAESWGASKQMKWHHAGGSPKALRATWHSSLAIINCMKHLCLTDDELPAMVRSQVLYSRNSSCMLFHVWHTSALMIKPL